MEHSLLPCTHSSSRLGEENKISRETERKREREREKEEEEEEEERI